jgi:DNA-binding NtrC family response regulator
MGVRLYAAGLGMASLRVVAPLVLTVALRAPATPGAAEQGDDPFPEIIGRSASIRRLKQQMTQLSGKSVPVLITGSTGTGKELVARGIHRAGPASELSFVAVDCGAIPEHLLESELFGAARGAYTDSRRDRPGLLESAAGGTLFLDEIGNMAPQLQAKLLRVLETGAFRRLGDTIERKARFRLLAATNRDLMNMVAGGEFRSDLYYRIAVMVLRLPDLTERIEDVPLLVDSFVQSLETSSGQEEKQQRVSVTRAAMQKLASHDWPGNVRELRNVVHRAVVMSAGNSISDSDIVFEEQGGVAPDTRCETLERAMARHVHRVVEMVDGNRTRAASVLRCDPKTVRKYLGIYEGLEDT